MANIESVFGDIDLGQIADLFEALMEGRDELPENMRRLTRIFDEPEVDSGMKSFKSLKAMKKESTENQNEDASCAICIDDLCKPVDVPDGCDFQKAFKVAPDDLGKSVTVAPCHHRFHTICLTLWFSKKNTCPSCRHKVKTDGELEEEEKEKRIEELHDSMYS